MADRKAELERKKERLRQMREEKERRRKEKEKQVGNDFGAEIKSFLIIDGFRFEIMQAVLNLVRENE